MNRFVFSSAVLLSTAMLLSWVAVVNGEVPQDVYDFWLGSGGSGPSLSTSEDSDDDERPLFTPAKSIKYLKNDIDPELFQWINPDEVAPGAITCGFLYPELGTEESIIYPTIEVYICMQFATIQPAPKGNLVVHCGGPESLTSCVLNMGSNYTLGQDNVDNYNIISIDQRGMGRSYPSLAHPECVNLKADVLFTEDFNETTIRTFLAGAKEKAQNCWTCEECGFFLNATGEDGSTIPLNFLQYAGTRQLAEDLYRFMYAIGSETLSLYGISYGTNVMATFATMFPNAVDKFVIDSNMPPYSDLKKLALQNAIGIDFRFDYIQYTCWAAEVENPGSCPIDDLGQCLRDLAPYNFGVSDILSQVGIGGFGGAYESVLFLIQMDPQQGAKLCDAAADGNEEDVETIFYTMFEDLGIDIESRTAVLDCSTYSLPTDEDDGPCFAVSKEQYGNFSGSLFETITGMDFRGAVEAYNEDAFVESVMEVDERYNSANTHGPAQQFAIVLSGNYYWPRNVPLPVRGNPNQHGIVSGQLYDKATPYEWTADMRANFPLTYSLTSQSINHGLEGGPDGPCQKYIVRYFETGDFGATDGTVCGDPYPYFNNLGEGSGNVDDDE